jgi:hypothetical protein
MLAGALANGFDPAPVARLHCEQWQAIMYDIRTCLWEDAYEIAASLFSLRLIGYLPKVSDGECHRRQ